MRNPPTSSHTSALQADVTILIKLHQVDLNNRKQVRIAAGTADWISLSFDLHKRTLHEDLREHVALQRWGRGRSRALDAFGGLKVFLISCSMSVEADTLVI